MALFDAVLMHCWLFRLCSSCEPNWNSCAGKGMLPHIALGKNWFGISVGQSLEQKSDPEEWVTRTHFLVVYEKEHVLWAGQGMMGCCREAFGAGSGGVPSCDPCWGRWSSSYVVLTYLLIPFLSVNIVRKGEKVHLYGWFGCIYIFSPCVFILYKESSFWTFQPVGW